MKLQIINVTIIKKEVSAKNSILQISTLAMPKISNKKKKFIKRNFRQLSLEELSRKTGLKPNVIRSLIDEYSAEVVEKDQSAQEKRDGIFLSWKIILLISLLFAGISLLIYSSSLRGPFMFDGKTNIQNAPLTHITKLSQLPDVVFPNKVNNQTRHRTICFMSFALNYYFGGLDTFGYHLVNVIIHILNGLVLFFLSYTILTLSFHEAKERENALMIAFLGSLLWLTHPIQTQAVSYIYQRLASLTAFFFLLSLFCYIKGRVTQAKTRAAFFVLSILFGLCALFTKQNAATLPFFIILAEFFLFQPQSFKLERKKLIFLILFAGLFILIAGIYLRSDFISRIALGYEKREWTLFERVLTQPRVVIFYLSLLIFPHPSRLNLDHDFAISHSLFSPFTTFLSLLFIIGSIGLAIFLMRRNRLISFALFWFFGNLVIESSILPLEMVFEHRVYLPSMGLIVLLIGLFVSLTKKEWEKWVTALVIPFILLFSYWTYERDSVWGNTLTLWTDAAKKSPHKARPHYNLGNIYYRADRFDEAISEHKKAITIEPNDEKAHYNLGNAYFKKGKLANAIVEYKQAILIKPDHAKAHYNLGTCYYRKGKYKLATVHRDKAKQLGYMVNSKL